MKGYDANGAWICHTGKVRKVNEDACLFGGIFSGASTSAPMRATASGKGWIIAVADGIGGHRAGAYASREVLASLAELTEFHPEGVAETLEETNRRLQQIGRIRPELEGTGAVVAGLVLGKDGLFAFNVGDARLYQQQEGQPQLITRDDSVEQFLVNEGLLKAHDGVRSVFMHALTQCIGGSSDSHAVKPHFYPLKVVEAARFLLCTDGLTDMLAGTEIQSYLVPRRKPAAAVQALFSAAMAAGGRDNITIAVVDAEPA